MIQLLGAGNGIREYGAVILVYAALFILMRHAQEKVELNFRHTFWLLFWAWAASTFAGNYVLHRLGLMSFLPWLNNALHTFVWIGLCLGFLYASSHSRPLWHQFLLFTIYSAIVKFAERALLGTWEHGDFLGLVPGNLAYILGWSLCDGLYPALSGLGLRVLSRWVPGLIAPGIVKLHVPLGPG